MNRYKLIRLGLVVAAMLSSVLAGAPTANACRFDISSMKITCTEAVGTYAASFTGKGSGTFTADDGKVYPDAVVVFVATTAYQPTFPGSPAYSTTGIGRSMPNDWKQMISDSMTITIAQSTGNELFSGRMPTDADMLIGVVQGVGVVRGTVTRADGEDQDIAMKLPGFTAPERRKSYASGTWRSSTVSSGSIEIGIDLNSRGKRKAHTPLKKGVTQTYVGARM